jgi:L-fucose mutarotase/ribose pyranase (RbsD/FucU family)
MTANWKDILKDRLLLYGHRNWLVIADSAYPAQSRQAIETIVVDDEQITVLEQTLAIMGGCKHIEANIYTDRELNFIGDDDAPGISSYRQKLGALLKGHQVRTLPHEEIISTLDRVGEKFRVLLIKTNMRIPYTSLFLELECGYWNPDAEKRLRISMRSKNGTKKGLRASQR